MKELSIEEKAKAYDEALEKARCKYQDHDTPWSDEDIEDIFPELAESEDERVRKKVIDVLKLNVRGAESQMQASRGVDRTFEVYACNKVIAWLEKKGEQKPVEDVNGDDYGIDSLWHAQRILEKTLGKVEGYQSDDGILEHECAISAVKKLYEQKSVWSEEDETYRNYILTNCINYADKMGYVEEKGNRFLHQNAKDWLKDLKSRVQPQNRWKPSDEQLDALETAAASLQSNALVSLHSKLINL